MKITDKIIMEASTGGTGAWTSASFRALGLKWPIKHGWQKFIKSQNYTEQQVRDFINGKFERVSKISIKHRNAKVNNAPMGLIMWKAFVKNNFHNHDLNDSLAINRLYREYVIYCLGKKITPIEIVKAVEVIDSKIYRD